MINSVSSVNFKAAAPQYNDPFARPGKYTKPADVPVADQPKKSHKALKWILGITTAAIATGALLIVGKNKNWFKILEEGPLKEAKFLEKCGHYLGKAGEALDKNIWKPVVRFTTETLPEKCKELWAKIKPNKTEKAAEAVAEKAEEVVATVA